jgi:anti-sigma factor RsiW
MRNDPTNPDPSPEQLAAFFDGELDPAARTRVEAWLAGRPDAAAEIDGQRRAVRLWNDNPPPEPGPDDWAATLAGIQARLPARSRRPRALPRTLWLCAGLAAAVLVAALLTRLFMPAAPRPVDKHDPPVAKGPPDAPAQEPILLVGQNDVSIINMEPFWRDDGQVPHIGEGDVPMIVAPQIDRAVDTP